MASPPDSFFQRLTRLFQSGPAIQRRVKGYDPKNILGNQMQHGNLTYRTSAPFGFGKDSSQFGGMGSYGIVDRMSRYSDFLSMEYCLAGNTKIATPGGYKTIKQLSDEYGLDKEFLVYSYDVNTKRIVPSSGKQARKTRTDHAWEVTFNNGKKIVGTANHRLLKRDGTFCQIENLSVGDSMMPFDRKMFVADKSRITKLLQQSKKIKKDNQIAGRKDINFGRILETCEKIGFDIDKLCLAFDTDKKTIESHLMKFGYRDFGIFESSYKTNPALIKELNKKSIVTFDKICKAYEPGMHYRDLIAKLNSGTNKHVIFKKIKEHGFMSWKDMKTFYNDLKITNIQYHGVIDLYDLTVDGHKNFATNTVISHNTPEIASALNVYADEMVGGDDRGKCFHVYSDNPQIKRALDELFYDVVNIEFNLRPWARNLVKFGDSFIVLEVIPDIGIVNIMSVPVAEIEREEGYNKEDPYAVRFKWITRGNKYLENWQVCHFRILSNDLHGQYGTSVLESSRKIWRQLVLLEEAMLTYRVVRSPERRVFYIDVANVPPNDVEAYMEAVKSTLKSNGTIDRNTGREDLRYNSQSILDDYWLPVRGQNQGTKIESLAGGQHVSAVEDVQYMQSKLLSALQIPKPYINFDEHLGNKAALSQLDIRLSRTVQSYQKILVAELNKMAMIHLYVKGFDGPDLINFDLKLSNPSSVALQQKLELWSVKFEIGGAAKETRLVDESWIQRNILELTADEILDIEKGLRKDQIRVKELEDLELKMPDKALPPKTTGIFDPSSYDVPGSNVPKTPAPPITSHPQDEEGDKPSPREVALSKYRSQDENGNVVDLDIKKAPIKATPFLTRYKKNRSRREGISTGTQNAAMPDITSMVSQRNKYTQDVYGQRYESTNSSITKQTQLLESMDDIKIRTLKDLGQEKFNIHIDPVLTNNMRSIFKNLDVYLESHPGNKKNLLKENLDTINLNDLTIETDGEDLLLEITEKNISKQSDVIEKVKEKSLTDILNEDDDS